MKCLKCGKQILNSKCDKCGYDVKSERLCLITPLSNQSLDKIQRLVKKNSEEIAAAQKKKAEEKRKQELKRELTSQQTDQSTHGSNHTGQNGNRKNNPYAGKNDADFTKVKSVIEQIKGLENLSIKNPPMLNVSQGADGKYSGVNSYKSFPDDIRKVASARNAYDELTAKEQKYINNYSVLLEAESCVNDFNKANEVERQIEKVLEVTFPKNPDIPNKNWSGAYSTPDLLPIYRLSEILAAKKAFDALTDRQKQYVRNYDRLQFYTELMSDYEKAVNFDQRISMLGKLSEDKSTEVAEIRENYNSLTDRQKMYVKNLSVLIDAEAYFNNLRRERERIRREEENEREQQHLRNINESRFVFVANLLVATAMTILHSVKDYNYYCNNEWMAVIVLSAPILVTLIYTRYVLISDHDYYKVYPSFSLGPQFILVISYVYHWITRQPLLASNRVLFVYSQICFLIALIVSTFWGFELMKANSNKEKNERYIFITASVVVYLALILSVVLLCLKAN